MAGLLVPLALGSGSRWEATFSRKEDGVGGGHKPYRCPVNMEHIRQSRPDSGPGFQVNVLETYEVVPSSLGSGPEKTEWCRSREQKGSPVPNPPLPSENGTT